MSKALHFVLLLASLPLLVPSLILTRLQARRWGRIPGVMIAIDAVVLLIVVAALPRLFPVWVVSVLCAYLLSYFRGREGKHETGIFLGYSNMVAWGLIVSGCLLLFGAVKALPSGAISGALKSHAPKEVSAAQIAGMGVAAGAQVKVPASTLEWDKRATYAVINGRTEPVDAAADPAGVGLTLIPFVDGENRVWAWIPGPLTATPATVEGRLAEPDDDERGLLIYTLSQRLGGAPIPSMQFIIKMGAAAEPPASPKGAGDPAGWWYLWGGLILGALTIARAIEE